MTTTDHDDEPRGDGLTAAEHRAAAAAAHQRSADSFERCDTDGFLSQWANTMTARKHERWAQLLQAGGMAEFPALYRAGQPLDLLDAREVHTRYGWAWAIDRRDGAVQWFTPSRHPDPVEAARRNAAKGYRVGHQLRRALVVMGEHGPYLVPADGSAQGVGR